MKNLTDKPYGKLKENERAYEVMLLRDQYDNAYKDIAKGLGVSVGTAVRLYHQAKHKQLRLYALHLAIVHGHKDTSEFAYMKLYDCYGDFKYVSAYWETEYSEILKAYRAGEPGHSDAFLAAVLPPIKEIRDEMVQRIVFLREANKTFVEIGHEMKLTKEKTKDTYDHFYHIKWLAACDLVRKTYYDGKDDGDNLRDYYDQYRTPKKRLEGIMRDYPELFGLRSGI